MFDLNFIWKGILLFIIIIMLCVGIRCDFVGRGETGSRYVYSCASGWRNVFYETPRSVESVQHGRGERARKIDYHCNGNGYDNAGIGVATASSSLFKCHNKQKSPCDSSVINVYLVICSLCVMWHIV